MIRVGIGGWEFPPWRQTFYPKGTKPTGQLAYASRALTSIEINSTFYITQPPETFARWRDETPEGFVFAVKAQRSVTNRKDLGTAGDAVKWFLDTGLFALGDRLGPILWQLAHTKKFNADETDAFLSHLPKTYDGRPLLHAFEVRHESFLTPDYVALARKHGVATVYADAKYPSLADPTGPFMYARLQGAEARLVGGYRPVALDAWAERAKRWHGGGVSEDLPLLAAPPPAVPERPVFVYFINGAKERAPAAALGLIKRLAR